LKINELRQISEKKNFTRHHIWWATNKTYWRRLR
jgi:hypothetical protein